MQFMDFIACGFDQIVNMAAKMHYRWGPAVPMVIRGPSGAGVHGGPYHSQSNEMWFVHTPGLKVVAPATAYDAKGLIKAAIRDDNPVIFYEHKFLYRRIKEKVSEQDYVVPIGKAVVRRTGTEKEGLSLEVVDLRSLLPYDEETVLASARKCSKVILLHEDTRTGGMAGELAALIAEKAFEDLDGPIVRVTAPDTPVPFAPPLEEYFLPNAQRVAEAARKLAAY
jgi:2-oxoisovalerate dehydrogenase E1 component beta subunit